MIVAQRGFRLLVKVNRPERAWHEFAVSVPRWSM
jgi:hypothetical protein